MAADCQVIKETVDPRVAAREYLKEKSIHKLFEELGSSLLYNQPENPLKFIAEDLKRIKKCREEKKHSSLFSDEDLCTIYGIMDTEKSGEISREQMISALKHIGVVTPETIPEGMYKVSDFRRLAKSELSKN